MHVCMTYEILSFGLFGSFSRDIVLVVKRFTSGILVSPGIVHSLRPTLNVQLL